MSLVYGWCLNTCVRDNVQQRTYTHVLSSSIRTAIEVLPCPSEIVQKMERFPDAVH